MAGVINCESNVKVQNIIDAIPEEMLVKIFGFLDSTSIKNMTLVNKRCYDIVTTEISTMKKLRLIIPGDLFRKDQLTFGNWNFHKVSFNSIKKICDVEMLSSLNSIGSNIREIEFIGCFFRKPKVFQDILRNFPKVEKLTFENCYFRRLNRVKKSDTDVLELENLNEIVLDQRCLMVFGCIGAQLKSLIIKMPKGFKREASGGVFIDEHQLMKFLYTQKKLETLALIDIYALNRIFAKQDNAEFQFKLKTLSLYRIRYEAGFNYENLKGFLNTQKDSIEILELEDTFSKDVYELILNKFENVKTLRIDTSDFPHDLSFYKRIKTNKNVTKLILENVVSNVDHYYKILSLFPNVTEVICSRSFRFEVLFWLSSCYNTLTSLSLCYLRNGHYQNLKFPALRNLHFEWIVDDDENEWSDLVMSNRTIESLSITYISRSEEFVPVDSFGKKIKMVCEVLPNLKHLKFGEDVKVNMCDLQKIVEKCKNLESIDVMGEKVGMMPMRKGFKFRCNDLSFVDYVFPSDEPVWQYNMRNENVYDYYDYEMRAYLPGKSHDTNDTDYDCDYFFSNLFGIL